jgi:hypothetical protein
MFSEDYVGEMRQTVANLNDVLVDIRDRVVQVRTRSTMNTKQDPWGVVTITSLTDECSIHYDLKNEANDLESGERYAINISKDLKLHNLSRTGTIFERGQQRLREEMIKEWTYSQLKEALNHHDEKQHERLLILIEWCHVFFTRKINAVLKFCK